MKKALLVSSFVMALFVVSCGNSGNNSKANAETAAEVKEVEVVVDTTVVAGSDSTAVVVVDSTAVVVVE